MKLQCSNCPAKNSRVKLITILKHGLRTRDLFLCENCHAILRQLQREENERIPRKAGS